MGIIRELGRLLALLIVLSGCGLMFAAFGGETLKVNTPIVSAILGAGFSGGGLLLYLSINIEKNNELLEDLIDSVEKNTTTNIEIARRQHQAEQLRPPQ